MFSLWNEEKKCGILQMIGETISLVFLSGILCVVWVFGMVLLLSCSTLGF